MIYVSYVSLKQPVSVELIQTLKVNGFKENTITNSSEDLHMTM